MRTSSLAFSELRVANVARQLKSFPQCVEWTPAQILQALIGELGEYANFRKKFERGDLPQGKFVVEANKELADVQIYLDLLAHALNIDLGQATIAKFNEVSHRVGSEVFL